MKKYELLELSFQDANETPCTNSNEDLTLEYEKLRIENFKLKVEIEKLKFTITILQGGPQG